MYRRCQSMTDVDAIAKSINDAYLDVHSQGEERDIIKHYADHALSIWIRLKRKSWYTASNLKHVFSTVTRCSIN